MRPLFCWKGVIQMNNRMANQSFNVDDIRIIREKADIRYQGMSPEEISKDISRRAQVGYDILKKLKDEKEKSRHTK